MKLFIKLTLLESFLFISFVAGVCYSQPVRPTVYGRGNSAVSAVTVSESSGTAAQGAGINEMLWVSSSGYVASAPYFKYISTANILTFGDGAGSFNIYLNKSASGNGVLEFLEAGAQRGVIYLDNSENLQLYTVGANDLRFGSNNSQGKMVVDGPTGNVGIGTLAPVQKLSISSGVVFIDGTSPSLRISVDGSGIVSKLDEEGLSLNRSGGSGYIIWQNGSGTNDWTFARAPTSFVGELRLHAGGGSSKFLRVSNAFNSNPPATSVDTNNNRLGVNISSPTMTLDVDGAIKSTSTVVAESTNVFTSLTGSQILVKDLLNNQQTIIGDNSITIDAVSVDFSKLQLGSGFGKWDLTNDDAFLTLNLDDSPIMQSNNGTNVTFNVPVVASSLEAVGAIQAGGAVNVIGSDSVIVVATRAAIPATDARYAMFYATGTTTAEMWVLDGAGNTTQLSPHNTVGEWIFNSYSAEGEQTYINMTQFIQRMEAITGEKFFKRSRRKAVMPYWGFE